MVVKFLKGTGPGVLFAILIALFAVWATALLKPLSIPASYFFTEPMPLYGLLIKLVKPDTLPGTLLSVVIVALNASLIVRLNTSWGLISERTFLPAFIYIVLAGIFPDHQHLNPVLPSSLFLLLAFMRIMESYNNPDSADYFFDAGILISCGTLFYAGLIGFCLLIFVGLAILRTGNLREISISIIGLIAPYFLVFGIYYVTGHDMKSFVSMLISNLLDRTVINNFPVSELIVIALITAGVILSIAQVYGKLNSKKIKSRKMFTLLMGVFLISLAMYLFIPSVTVEIYWITIIPVSYFLGHYFVTAKRKILPNIYFLLFLLLIIFIKISFLK
jgi:hypothetical protein